MIRETFDKLRGRGELAFIPYQTAGYPTLTDSISNLRRLAEAGADIVELGIPFSDPMADGPTIQYTSQIALENGVTLRDTLGALKASPPGCAVVVMSYLNPLLAIGRDNVCAALADAGVSGLIVPDLAPEEADAWREATSRAGVDLIFLLAPTSTDARIRAVTAQASGFVYAVSIAGTTGARRALSAELPTFLRRVRDATDLPVVVGFGISKPEHVHALRDVADGVIVASRLLDAMRQDEDWEALARSLKQATRS